MRLIHFFEATNESDGLVNGFPTVHFPTVYHMGDMDPSKKSQGSHEGSGLSVSTHPDAWRKIARLGGRDTKTLVNGSSIFLDFHELTKKQKNIILQWGVENEYVTPASLWRVYYYDDEMEDTMSMEFTDQAEAEFEAEGVEGKVQVVRGSHVATPKMQQRVHGRAEPIMIMDLLSTIFVEDSLGWDGVWWDDELHPGKLSAPRGVIVPSKLGRWHVENPQLNENQQLIATAMKWAKDSYGELMFGHKPEDFEWTVHQNFPVSEFGDEKEWIDLFGREREAVKFRARKGNKRAEQELADWQDIVQTGARKPVMALKYPERKGTAGGYEILDGYHRIGATFTSGRPTLPAVIGVINPKMDEAHNVPSAMSIEFTCGACMFFAYVLNRKFGWPIAGTFMESPTDPEKGMPGEISSMDDYEAERISFGHAWAQPTDNISVDIEGATTAEKMKARWMGYPYTHVTNIDPEWMGQFLKGRLNSGTRRGIWKRAMQAAKMLRSHLKGEGLLEGGRFNAPS